jgi:hypothetical protein
VRDPVELQYEFQEPFIVDSTKIATKLNAHATPLDQASARHLGQLPRHHQLTLDSPTHLVNFAPPSDPASIGPTLSAVGRAANQAGWRTCP